MLLRRWPVQLALMASCVLAFHPFYPPYNRLEDRDDTPSDLSSHGPSSVAQARELSTLKIRQRLPTDDLPREQQISRYLKRLSKKFEARSDPITKRTNGYSIAMGVTPSQANSAALDQDGSDFSYFALVKFGSSATPLYILMDTGASATWVMGSSCASKACTLHNTYGAETSTTFKATSTVFDLAYGTGHVNGFMASDVVSFAGLSPFLTFGVANTTSDDFVNFPFDGIMGLARTTGSYPTALGAISTAKLLKSNIFGVNLDRSVDGSHDGEINFGAPDTSKFVGNINYTPLVSNSGDWAITADGVSFNGKSAGITGRTAFIDTGTSYIFLPPTDAQALYSLIPGSEPSTGGGSWNVPCATTASVQFTFSGVTYNVPSKDWVGSKSSGNLCYSNIFPGTPVGANNWLLGDSFMKNVYTVFDADQNRIGFGAKSSASSSSVAASSTLLSGPAPTNKSNLTAATTNSGSPGFDAAITSSALSPAQPTLLPSASTTKPAGSGSTRSQSRVFMVSLCAPLFITLILV